MKRLMIVISILLLALISVATYAYLDLIRYAKKLPDGEPAEHIVIVRPGQGFNSFSENIYHKGIIEHPLKFRLLARMKRYETKMKAGEYSLSSSMTPEKILDIIVHGKVRLHRLTVPEGYNLRQIARVVEASGFGSREDFLTAATNADFVHQMGIEAETFEGYLFPDTYLFPKGEIFEKIISTMVKRFWSAFKPEWRRRAEALGFSIHEIVTFASIIEKEASVASERPIISSVFHNRLKRSMRLQSDPTVIYGIKNFDGNIKRKHLAQPGPYNTYTIKGLPPGPIANSGVDSLEAALYPADTKYLFFVSKKDTTHHFSMNLKDHNRAVRKYQLGK